MSKPDNAIMMEQRLRDVMSPGSTFEYGGGTYTVEVTDKPVPGDGYGGECKTDCYILARDEYGDEREFRISYKMESAGFVENKIDDERAEAIFGEDWERTIRAAIDASQDAIYDRDIVMRQRGETKMTLGWRCDILNNGSGRLVVPFSFDQYEKVEIYSGTNIAPDKIDGVVCGDVVPGSGVANFYLETDDLSSPDAIVSQLVPIDLDHADLLPDLFIRLVAVNYRLEADKWDGDRALAVAVSWFVDDGALDARIVTDEPFAYGGNGCGDQLLGVLDALGIDDAGSLMVCPKSGFVEARCSL